MSDWKKLFEGFKNSRDCALAFNVVAAAGDQWSEGMNRVTWLDDALHRVGLPSAREILDQAAFGNGVGFT